MLECLANWDFISYQRAHCSIPKHSTRSGAPLSVYSLSRSTKQSTNNMASIIALFILVARNGSDVSVTIEMITSVTRKNCLMSIKVAQK